MDETNGQIVCGVDLKKTTNNNSKDQPTIIVSEVDSHGIVIITFNEPMDVSSFFNNDFANSRSLQNKSGGVSSGFESYVIADANSTKETNFDRNKYLLSSKHLKITM